MQASLHSPFVCQTLAFLDAKRSRADLESLAALIDAGVLRPIVERTLPLAQVADAMRHAETGHAGQGGYCDQVGCRHSRQSSATWALTAAISAPEATNWRTASMCG